MNQRVSLTRAVMIAGALFIGSGLAAAPAMAASMTFNFTGAVSDVSAALFPHLTAGHSLTGSYTFNTATIDSNPSANIGRYNGTIQALTVNLVPTIGSTYTATLGSAGSNFIEIRNQPSSDRYLVQAPLTGPLVNGYSPLRFRIELIDPTATAFGNDLLPSTPPSLSSFAASRFRIVFEDGSGNARVRGTLTSLTAVPLPTAVILFGAGLLALVGLGAGSRRQKQAGLA
jgi:hypothetical protein